MNNGTILELDTLAAKVAEHKAAGRKIVHCHGVFDLLHIGHIRHFQKARELGDVLVVTITPDEWVNKGPTRPAFPQDLRMEAVASLKDVNHVALNRWPTAVETISLLAPDVYAKGEEYEDKAADVTGGIAREREAVESVGGTMAFTRDITFSSSALINDYLCAYPDNVRCWLHEFKRDHCAGDLLDVLGRLRNMRVLVLGETIIDEYHYCETLGKSGKEPILAVRYCDHDTFAGGILAVANHMAGFLDKVNMVSFLGEINSHESFIRQHLSAGVEAEFLTMPKAPTIIKRRFIEKYPFQKMFEVYVMGDLNGERGRLQGELRGFLESRLHEYDLVLVTDYGHDMFGPEVVDLLCDKAPFLAVNTQTNAGNYGFNDITKYPRADYVCISEKELRMAKRNRTGDLCDLVLQMVKRMGCRYMYITQGEKGCLSYSLESGFAAVPAFASHFVDRVGAGDAVFAVTSMCVARGLDAGQLGLIGNVVGAEAVLSVSNSRHMDTVSISKHITALLK